MWKNLPSSSEAWIKREWKILNHPSLYIASKSFLSPQSRPALNHMVRMLNHLIYRNGQGYTGVAIATDIGLRVYTESDKKSIVDVFDCVNKMRNDRNGIVSSKDLYKYIFKVSRFSFVCIAPLVGRTFGKGVLVKTLLQTKKHVITVCDIFYAILCR